MACANLGMIIRIIDIWSICGFLSIKFLFYVNKCTFILEASKGPLFSTCLNFYIIQVYWCQLRGRWETKHRGCGHCHQLERRASPRKGVFVLFVTFFPPPHSKTKNPHELPSTMRIFMRSTQMTKWIIWFILTHCPVTHNPAWMSSIFFFWRSCAPIWLQFFVTFTLKLPMFLY